MMTDEYQPLATMADAHREWHLNSGVPMGTPGCPQDACHPVEDFEPEDKPTVKCGNRKYHLATHGTDVYYHHTPAEVRECYAHSGRFAVPAAQVAQSHLYTQQAEDGPVSITVDEAVQQMRAHQQAQQALEANRQAREAAQAAHAERVARFARWSTIPVENGEYADYALLNTAGDPVFYRVRRPITGKYAGRTYVDRYSSDSVVRMPWGEAADVLDAIARNPLQSAILYGQRTERCGICHRKLTKKESRERGIGPVCASRMGS